MQLPAISTEICLAAESNQRLQSKLHDFALGLATGSLECIFHQFVIDEDGHAHGRVNTFRSRIEIVVQRHTERYRPSGRLDATRHPLNIAQSPARLARTPHLIGIVPFWDYTSICVSSRCGRSSALSKTRQSTMMHASPFWRGIKP